MSNKKVCLKFYFFFGDELKKLLILNNSKNDKINFNFILIYSNN